MPLLCCAGTKQRALTSRCGASPAGNPPSRGTASWASAGPRCRRWPRGAPAPPRTQGCCIYWFPPRTALSQTGNLKSGSLFAPSSRCGFHVCGAKPMWTVSKEPPPSSSPKTQALLVLSSAPLHCCPPSLSLIRIHLARETQIPNPTFDLPFFAPSWRCH